MTRQHFGLEGKIIEFLCRAILGENPNFASSSGSELLLHEAVEHSNELLLRAAIKLGVDIDRTDLCNATALDRALLLGKTSLARILIEAGANMNVKESLTNTVYNKNVDSVKLIMEFTDLKEISPDDLKQLYDLAQLNHCHQITSILRRKERSSRGMGMIRE